MSSIQDMHIYLDLELNKINSKLYDILLSEEKDYFLNKAQERIVKQRYGALSNSKGQGFEMSQKRIDDLRNLVVPNYYDKAYLLDTDDFDYTRKLRFYFPNDYWFLTSQRSKVYGSDCSTITTTANNQVVYYNIIDLSTTLDSFETFKIYNSVNTVVVENLDYAIEDKNLFLIALVDLWNTTYSTLYGWTFYIDNYYNISSPGNIIAIAKTNVGQVIKYGFGAPDNTFVTNQSNTYQYYTATGGTEAVVTNRFAQQDDVYSMQQDPFNNTIYYAPLVIIHNNSIDLFIDKNNFIVKEVAISYIRRPKLMSLTLNQSCELAEHLHAEILRDAVNLILESFQADQRLVTSTQVEQTNE